jgi:hypothetical protein
MQNSYTNIQEIFYKNLHSVIQKTRTYIEMDYLTNSMKRDPTWEADSRSADQEVLRLLWKTKVHYRVHMIPSLNPILR